MSNLGRFAGTNQAASDGAVLEGGTWSAALPLANLTDKRLVSHPARCEDAGDLAKSQFDLVLPRRRKILLVCLLSTTLSGTARVRLTFADDDLEDPEHQTEWLDAFPRAFTSASLDWEDPNFWTGRPQDRDLDAYHRNAVLQLPQLVSVSKMRVEIDDSDNAAGTFDIGFVFVAGGFSPAFNYDWGGQLALDTGTLVDVTPGGTRILDRRSISRRVAVNYSNLTKDEAMTFLDAAARADIEEPVLFVPAPDDARHLFREVFLAHFDALPSRTSRDTGSSVPLQLKEIIA